MHLHWQPRPGCVRVLQQERSLLRLLYSVQQQSSKHHMFLGAEGLTKPHPASLGSCTHRPFYLRSATPALYLFTLQARTEARTATTLARLVPQTRWLLRKWQGAHMGVRGWLRAVRYSPRQRGPGKPASVSDCVGAPCRRGPPPPSAPAGRRSRRGRWPPGLAAGASPGAPPPSWCGRPRTRSSPRWRSSRAGWASGSRRWPAQVRRGRLGLRLSLCQPRALPCPWQPPSPGRLPRRRRRCCC